MTLSDLDLPRVLVTGLLTLMPSIRTNNRTKLHSSHIHPYFEVGRFIRQSVCSVQCAVCSVQCAVCSVYCALCNFHCSLCIVQYEVCRGSIQCTVCSVQCAVCREQGSVGTLVSHVFRLRCMVPAPIIGQAGTAQWTVNAAHWTLHSEQCTVNSEHCTLKSVQWTVHSALHTHQSPPSEEGLVKV